MLSYENLENDITAQINTYLASIEIADDSNAMVAASTLIEAIVVPENEAEAEALKQADKSFVVVQYIGGDVIPSTALQQVSQEENLLIRTNFIAPKLRGTTGIFSLIRYVKLALLGFKPANCILPLQLDKPMVADYATNRIMEELTFKTKTVLVQRTYEEPLLGYPQRIPNYNVQTPN